MEGIKVCIRHYAGCTNAVWSVDVSFYKLAQFDCSKQAKSKHFGQDCFLS